MGTALDPWVDAERHLIEGVLRDSALLGMVLLQPEQFAAEAHRVIWRACRHLHAQGAQVTTRTLDVLLAEYLRDEPQRLAKLRGYVQARYEHGKDGIVGPEEARDHARVVAEYSEVRAQAADLEVLLRMAQANDRRVLSEVAKVGLRAASAGTRVPEGRTWSAIMQSTLDTIWARQEKKLPASVPTGLPSLDDLALFLPGKMIVLGGRPGTGKSALALRLVTSAIKKGHRALFVSLEMKDEELCQRVFAMEASVPASRLLVGDGLTKEDWEYLHNAQQQMEPWPLAVMDDTEQRLEAIAARARHEKATRGLDLLAVDYIQLIDVERHRNGTREQDVAALSRGLKKLARELSCPILALAQLRRFDGEETGARPSMSDLRESGAQENDADAILLLSPDLQGKTMREWEDQPSRRITCAVAKNRSGPKRDVTLLYHAPHVSFLELDSAHA